MEKQPQRPQAVSALAAVYGEPGQAGFGSAVFYRPAGTDDDLETLAKATYRHFVGKLWNAIGEAAWLGQWREVYARTPGAGGDVVAELRSIKDAEAARSVPLVLDVVEQPEACQEALGQVFNDPEVTELRVFNLGDGGAMSGLLIAGRQDRVGAVTQLIVLMD